MSHISFAISTAAGSTAWSTIGEILRTTGEFALLVFAIVQVWLQVADSRDRRRTAYAALYAEYWRVSALEMDWSSQSLVTAAVAGVLDPEMLAPKDWGTTIRLLGEVSSATAALGGFAYSLVNSAIDSAKLIRAIAANPALVSNPSSEMARQESLSKTHLKEAVLASEDAMRAAPSWLGRHKFTLVDPQSEVGKKLEEHLLKLQRRLAGPRHEPRFGIVGTHLGRLLAKAGRWFDPAA